MAAKPAKREQARLERRRTIARQAAIQFEDKLSEHELILMRMDALPEELREDNHDEGREQIVRLIESFKVMIESMRREAGPEPPAESNGDGNREQRRAAARAAKS